MERLAQLKQSNMEVQTVDETSEDEWTYSKIDNKPAENDTNMNTTNNDITSSKAAASKSLMQDIRRLVQEAEELVSPDKNRKKTAIPTPLNKISRVKQWLDMEKPDDSCDASGEDDEQESQMSEDPNESISTYRAIHESTSQNTSFTELDTTDSTPKVLMRQHKYSLKGPRPWSVSCISQFSQVGSTNT